MATTKKTTKKATPKAKATPRSTKAKCCGCQTAKPSTKQKVGAKKAKK